MSASIFTLPNDPRLKEVEGTVSFMLKFASGVIANCLTSYSVQSIVTCGCSATRQRGDRERLWLSGQRLRIFQRDGKADASTECRCLESDQFSLEIDHMALCVRNDVRPRTPGEEGLQDHILMAAIYESARTGQPVHLKSGDGIDTSRGPLR